jgi:hypothetical protein
MDKNMRALIRAWAEHAAVPFQGRPREDVHLHLQNAIGLAIRVGAPVIEGLDEVILAYSWDEENRISVVLDSEQFTDEMLVVRGAQCLQ